MSVDDKSELNPEQIAQEFNRRKWQNGEFRLVTIGGALHVHGSGPGWRRDTPIDDAQAIVAGWQAMEELAEVKIGLAQVSKLCDAEIELRQRFDWELDQARTQLAALTAEVERHEAEMDAVMQSVDKWFPEGDKRLLNNPATRACEARELALRAIEALEDAERLREPADGVEDDGWHFSRFRNTARSGEAPTLVATMTCPEKPPFAEVFYVDFGYDQNETRDLADKVITRLELRKGMEPADGVEAMARRIVTQLQLAFPDVPVYVTAAEQAAVIAAELRKGVEPAEGTWGWALAQMKAGKTIKRNDPDEDAIVSTDGVVMYASSQDALDYARFSLDDFDADDWQIHPRKITND